MADDDQKKSQDTPGISTLVQSFKAAETVAAKGGVIALLIAGLLLTVLPTLALVFGFTSTVASDFSPRVYVGALIAGAGIMVAAGIVGGWMEASIRRQSVAVFRLQLEQNTLALEMWKNVFDSFAQDQADARRTIAAQFPEMLRQIGASQSFMLGGLALTQQAAVTEPAGS